MVSIGRVVKVWVAVSLFSLLVWAIYWVIPGYGHFFNVVQGLPDDYVKMLGIVFWAASIGQNALVVGAVFGLVSIFLVWGVSKSFVRVRGWVAAALLLESAYYIGFVPTVFLLLNPDSSHAFFRLPYLGTAYLLQILFTVPFLIVLAVKVMGYSGPADKPGLLKWGGVAFAGLIGALWANAVLRWFDMLSAGGIAFLFSGIRGLGFFDAIILMSLALIFAVVGGYRLVKQKAVSAVNFLGLSMAMVALQYVIFLAYSYMVNVMASAFLIDVWTAPLLGLGLSLLITKVKRL